MQTNVACMFYSKNTKTPYNCPFATKSAIDCLIRNGNAPVTGTMFSAETEIVLEQFAPLYFIHTFYPTIVKII